MDISLFDQTFALTTIGKDNRMVPRIYIEQLPIPPITTTKPTYCPTDRKHRKHCR